MDSINCKAPPASQHEPNTIRQGNEIAAGRESLEIKRPPDKKAELSSESLVADHRCGCFPPQRPLRTNHLANVKSPPPSLPRHSTCNCNSPLTPPTCAAHEQASTVVEKEQQANEALPSHVLLIDPKCLGNTTYNAHTHTQTLS